eukprot:g24979.t1
MELDMVEQDVISYNAAISACEKGSKVDVALLLRDRMLHRRSAITSFCVGHGFMLEASTASAATAALRRTVKQHGTKAAQFQLRQMLQGTVEVNIIHFNTCIAACAYADWASSLELHNAPTKVNSSKDQASSVTRDFLLAQMLPRNTAADRRFHVLAKEKETQVALRVLHWMCLAQTKCLDF